MPLLYMRPGYQSSALPIRCLFMCSSSSNARRAQPLGTSTALVLGIQLGVFLGSLVTSRLPCPIDEEPMNEHRSRAERDARNHSPVQPTAVSRTSVPSPRVCIHSFIPIVLCLLSPFFAAPSQRRARSVTRWCASCSPVDQPGTNPMPKTRPRRGAFAVQASPILQPGPGRRRQPRACRRGFGRRQASSFRRGRRERGREPPVERHFGGRERNPRDAAGLVDVHPVVCGRPWSARAGPSPGSGRNISPVFCFLGRFAPSAFGSIEYVRRSDTRAAHRLDPSFGGV